VAVKKEFWKKKLCGIPCVVFSLRTDCEKYKKLMPIFNVGLVKNALCSDPENYFRINYNGRISVCCYDIRNEFVNSTIYEKSIGDIYYGREYQDIILDLRRGLRSKYRLCSTCNILVRKDGGRGANE
jgi:hypothetical protein